MKFRLRGLNCAQSDYIASQHKRHRIRLQFGPTADRSPKGAVTIERSVVGVQRRAFKAAVLKRKKLEATVTNLTDAIGPGELRSSPAIAKQLEQEVWSSG